MTGVELLAGLRAQGISLTVNGDKLKCKGKESALTPELLETLREHKADLMALLAAMCFCEAPMPASDIESTPCPHCDVGCRCIACGRCRWCAFQVRWRDNLEPKYRRGFSK